MRSNFETSSGGSAEILPDIGSNFNHSGISDPSFKTNLDVSKLSESSLGKLITKSDSTMFGLRVYNWSAFLD